MNHFFAYLSRLKLIKRWGLMRNVTPENSQEHSWQVATIAHALGLIQVRLFGGNVNANKAAVLALYHDASEVITGDLPTPVKYANKVIRDAYHALEENACGTLLSMLPKELVEGYEPLLAPYNSPETELVHIADKICAYLKCIEEEPCGNSEFAVARLSIEKILYQYEEERPEVAYFLEHFVPSFTLTLDELS